MEKGLIILIGRNKKQIKLIQKNNDPCKEVSIVDRCTDIMISSTIEIENDFYLTQVLGIPLK